MQYGQDWILFAMKAVHIIIANHIESRALFTDGSPQINKACDVSHAMQTSLKHREHAQIIYGKGES